MCRYVLVSMLIAPLVGPVLAASCGLAMRDAALLTRGARSFVALLALTVSLGAFVGVALTPLAMQGAASAFTWPTEEMATHGVWIDVLFSAVVSASGGVAAGLAVAAPWAVPSVVATALTASLIPPAVNAGLCGAFAHVGAPAVAALAGGSATRDFGVRVALLDEIAASSLLQVASSAFLCFSSAYLCLRVIGWPEREMKLA